MDTVSNSAILLWFLFFLILIIPGYFILKQVNKGMKARRQSRTWPVVEGSVSDASIEEKKRTTSGRSITGGQRKITVYQPIINYTFQVDSKQFNASRYKNCWPGEWADPSRRKAEAVINEYPAGKHVDVHYDPSDPAQAFLVVESSDAGLHATRVFGIVFIIGALICLTLGINGLGKNFIAKRELVAIVNSNAVIPVATSQIKTKLENDTGLKCQQEGFPGNHIAYRGWRCIKAVDIKLPDVEIWSRLDEPEKTDVIWVITEQVDPEENKEIMLSAIASVFSGADAEEAQKWCLGLLLSSQPISRTTTTIQGVPLTLDAPSDTRLNLIIGLSK